MIRPPIVRLALFASVALFVGAARARAQSQLIYSVDWKSRSVQFPNSSTTQPITEADLLVTPGGTPTYGPLPNPALQFIGSSLSLSKYQLCAGHAAGTACGIEVDALSDGKDAALLPTGFAAFAAKRRIVFSVDQFSRGILGPPPFHPQIASESNVGTNTFDVAADVFCDTGLPPGPLPPFAVTPNNAALIDGNGLASTSGFVYPGVGLREPTPPVTSLPNPGDNLDALDFGDWHVFPSNGAFFSLDSGFIDPVLGVSNSDSAAQEGHVGGDVLRVPAPNAPIQVYAHALQLGLDLEGPNTDDLDALALADDGDGIFQPSQVPYDWVGGPSPFFAATHDMLLFSVRRGSAVIGKPDSIFGIPISPGDILTTPLPPSSGGVSPYPGIMIAAENLGVGSVRSGTGSPFGDELDALDTITEIEFDCNKNGVEDAVDIATGTSVDSNGNGIPDECEQVVMPYCFCVTGLAPCGNDYAAGGCKNSTPLGAKMTYSGSTSVATDDLVLNVTQMPLHVSGIIFMGSTGKVPAPFQDGLRCVYGSTYRFLSHNSGATGTITYGPGIVAYSQGFSGGAITSGSTWYFQGWYRNAAGPCGTGTNLANALRIEFVP